MQDGTTPTPAETLAAATQTDVPIQTNERRATLIGTYIKPEGSTAIVRMRSGRIRQITLGDRIGQARVTLIEDGAIRVTSKDQNYRLTLPETA